MTDSVFLHRSAELGYMLREERVNSRCRAVQWDKMVVLGQLFVALIRKNDVKVEEVVSVKRAQHLSIKNREGREYYVRSDDIKVTLKSSGSAVILMITIMKVAQLWICRNKP